MLCIFGRNYLTFSLYYLKLSRRVYSPARLMVIQIGSTKHCFASALAQILNLFQNLLPIIYIIGSFVWKRLYKMANFSHFLFLYIINNVANFNKIIVTAAKFKYTSHITKYQYTARISRYPIIYPISQCT